MKTFKTPGVYVEEVSTLPPSVVPVETAIPAFIGYTEKRPSAPLKAHRITSLNDYHALFGGPFRETLQGNNIEVVRDPSDSFFTVSVLPTPIQKPAFWLYYQLQIFFANGGGPCFILSVGTYQDQPDARGDRRTELENALESLKKEDEPTLILLPDAMNLIPDNPVPASFANYYSVYQKSLRVCAEMKDRFTILDIHNGLDDLSGNNNAVDIFRSSIGTANLDYCASYYPWLGTTIGYAYDESAIVVGGVGLPEPDETRLKFDTTELDQLPDVDDGNGNSLNDEQKKGHYENRSLFHLDNAAYSVIKGALSDNRMSLPPGGAIAGVYASVDNARGVFKAPANVSLSNVIRPTVKINNDLQDRLNVHPTGKSVNAIRSFPGRGILVWGARTLDGNSNEFRYVSVRRFFIFAEESISKAINRFVFEPNTEGTWVKVKGTIENFLTDQWRAGALAGTTPQQAFFVKIALGETMTPQDILEGRLIVLVGIATVRPAEFIILQFTHKLQEA